MKNIRLMNQAEDFKKLGINSNEVELWEDGRRNHDTSSGNWEWWYFDAIMTDQTKVVVQFFTTSGLKGIEKDGDTPSAVIKITTPDGKMYEDTYHAKVTECSFATDHCNTQIGPCRFEGDLKTYRIQAQGKKGISVDLILESQSKPYRPGTAYFDLGEEEYYTWLCVVPTGKVSGSLNYEGHRYEVSGTGYHDHQWGNRFYLAEWNNWLWARQNFGDYSMLIFDYVAAERFGYQRLPIVFVQDKDGNIIFESLDNVDCSIPAMTSVEKKSKKRYPKKLVYRFTQGSRVLTYELENKEMIDSFGLMDKPFFGRMMSKKVGLNLAYARFHGQGHMVLTEDEVELLNLDNDLIYEFMYPGENAENYMSTDK